jgi:O-antigen ligase
MNLHGFNSAFISFIDWINFRFLLIISPIFLLTVKRWTNGCLLVLFLGAASFLIRSRKQFQPKVKPQVLWIRAITLALCGPLLAVAISQLLRGEFYAPNFDAPLRIALASVVFYAIASGWLQAGNPTSITKIWATTIIPICLLWTLLFKPAWTDAWGAERIVTYFVDPLSFGSICLVFALISFSSLTYHWGSIRWPYRILGLCGTICGFYLSIRSGSRTGWLNLPLFVLLWFYYIGQKKLGALRSLFIIIFATSVVIVSVIHHPLLSTKIVHAIDEIKNYKWSSMNVDDSVTMRISFYRMAIFYFFEAPFTGWGDLGWMKAMHAPELMTYASAFTRDFPKNGFHNEILTSTVRSGIWGLFASLGFFFVPILWSIKMPKSKHGHSIVFCSLFVLIFVTHQLLAGMTTEVTNLVFLASFLGLTLATVLGEGVYRTSIADCDMVR